jgi:hypothetical protein
MALGPLTVGFYEPQFVSGLDIEARFTMADGFWVQLEEEARREAKVVREPTKPQALTRHA